MCAPSPLPRSNDGVLIRYSSKAHSMHTHPARVRCAAGKAASVTVECDAATETLASAWAKLAAKQGTPYMDQMTVTNANGSASTSTNANANANGPNRHQHPPTHHLQDHSLVMLSARPGVKAAKGFFESIMYRKFIKLKEQGCVPFPLIRLAHLTTALASSLSLSLDE